MASITQIDELVPGTSLHALRPLSHIGLEMFGVLLPPLIETLQAPAFEEDALILQLGGAAPLATKGTTRWTNSSGGDWATAANWSPAEVPGQSASVVFGLDASYNVQVGTQQAGRVEVTDGSVGFNGAQLTLTGPLQVGNDADLVIPDGSVSAGEITIGSLPPPNPAQPPLARLAVSNPATTLTTGGPLRVGVAGDGQLDLNGGAKATSAEARLGDGAPGAANVRDANTLWTTGSLAVGHSVTGTLMIERGGHVVSRDAVVGLGTAPARHPGVVTVAGISGTTTSLWEVFGLLTIGSALPGQLTVSSGGSAGANSLQAGLQRPVAGDSAQIEVSGAGPAADQPSTLILLNDALLGMGDGASVVMRVVDGGTFAPGGDLQLAHEAGSTATLDVSGVNGNGARSTVEVGVGQSGGACNVGIFA